MESPVRYRCARPCPRLAACVARFWQVETTRTAGILPGRWALPDGGSEWVFVLGDPIRRAGAVLGGGAHAAGSALTAYHSRPLGRMLTFGVTFHPGGAAAFVPVPASHLAGGAVALGDLWGSAAGQLVEQLAAARDFAARVALVQRALLGRWRRFDPESPFDPEGPFGPEVPFDPEVAAALRRLRAEPGLPIRALTGDPSAARRLERKFLAAVGVPPKRLARMFRLQFAVRLWLAGEAPTQADLAARAGYSDQAHMAHEFRDLAAATPRLVLERERRMDVGFLQDDHGPHG